MQPMVVFVMLYSSGRHSESITNFDSLHFKLGLLEILHDCLFPCMEIQMFLWHVDWISWKGLYTFYDLYFVGHKKKNCLHVQSTGILRLIRIILKELLSLINLKKQLYHQYLKFNLCEILHAFLSPFIAVVSQV